MIYQEINLPIWAELLIMAILSIVIILLIRYEPPSNEEEKQTQNVKADNHVKERYGAYIQSQGRYYN
ncbi:hypothetical protein [Streptococcus sp. UBA3373]|uniref:hypothetical protein n=1 Tax=Streptococcus sp. UBA3373 TaxID=1947562 RepID=UPI0025CF059C|nr:hypothetical protein [Streptococcus sp. UBA3373]